MNATASTYTLLSSVNSFYGDTYAQLFATEFDDVSVYLMEHRRYDPLALSNYFCYWGVPNHMQIDSALKQMSQYWQAVFGHEEFIKTIETEP